MNETANAITNETAKEMGRTILRGAFGFVGSAFRRQLERQGVAFDCVTRLDDGAGLDGPVDLFIDCGGNSRKYLAERDPVFDRARNVDDVAGAIERFRPQRYLHLSSSAVYADVSSPEATREVDEPTGDVSAYGRHKREAERLVREGVAVSTILRPAGFFGPGVHKGPVYDFLEGKAPWVMPDSKMQLLDVDRFAARALDLATQGGTFNAVPAESTVLSDALPGEAADQEKLRGGRELPRLDFAMHASAFRDDGGTSLFRRFAQGYMMHEGRAECRVFLLAGGRGTRLGGDVPKPAVEVAGLPLAVHALRPFLDAGYDRFYALLEHEAEHVAGAICRGLNRDRIDRFVDDDAPGTGGAVLRALRRTVKPTVLIANADTVFRGFDPERLVKHHVRAGAIATVLAARNRDADAGGVLDLAPDGRVRSFERGRPADSTSAAVWVHAGCAVVDRARFLEACDTEESCSLEGDLFRSLIDRGGLHAYPDADVQFVDAGTPEGLERAGRFVEETER